MDRPTVIESDNLHGDSLEDFVCLIESIVNGTNSPELTLKYVAADAVIFINNVNRLIGELTNDNRVKTQIINAEREKRQTNG